MLLRFDPFRDLDEPTELTHDGRTRSIPLDAYRRDGLLHVDLDLPGVPPESVQVTVERNVVSIKAERRWTTEGAQTVVCERPVGTFSRQLFLGESLDADKVTASYRDGVLHLAVPVLEQAKPRRIEVTPMEAPEIVSPRVA